MRVLEEKEGARIGNASIVRLSQRGNEQSNDRFQPDFKSARAMPTT